jgi:hypothetical protein
VELRRICIILAKERAKSTVMVSGYHEGTSLTDAFEHEVRFCYPISLPQSCFTAVSPESGYGT